MSAMTEALRTGAARLRVAGPGGGGVALDGSVSVAEAEAAGTLRGKLHGAGLADGDAGGDCEADVPRTFQYAHASDRSWPCPTVIPRIPWSESTPIGWEASKPIRGSPWPANLGPWGSLPLKSIDVVGLTDAARSDLVSQLPVHVGDTVTSPAGRYRSCHREVR